VSFSRICRVTSARREAGSRARKLRNYILSGNGCWNPVNLNNRVHVQVFSNSIASCGACLPIQPSAELFDLKRCHWWPVLSDHPSKVLREGIDSLLEKEKGGSKGTQLPFINNRRVLNSRSSTTTVHSFI
jgi:hypothetical protein